MISNRILELCFIFTCFLMILMLMISVIIYTFSCHMNDAEKIIRLPSSYFLNLDDVENI